jgi:sugar lactone lactonase YvrE
MNSTTNTLLRFDNAFTAIGNATPAATIFGSSTTFNFPNFMFLDTANDRLYIADTRDISIVIYDNISTKNGNAAPSRIIAGPLHTTLSTPVDVALDRGRDLLYVADELEILVFAAASTTLGDVAPVRTLSAPFAVSAIFIDANNDRLFAADPNGNAVAVYDHASTLNGSITANRAIQGPNNTHLSFPSGLQVDGAGRLVVSNVIPGQPGTITIYANAATADGDQAPVQEIRGANTGISVPQQIAVDPSGTGTLYNADTGAGRIAVFANLNTANGNIAPTRSISGANTGLTAGGPVGVALDNTR